MSIHLRPGARIRPARGQKSLAGAMVAAQAGLFGCGAVLLVLGLIIWTGRANELIPIHILVGIVLVLALWTIAAIAARSGVSNSLVAGAVAWSGVAPILGATQESLLVGEWHWIVQVLHVVVSMGVVAWGRALVVLTMRGDGSARSRVSAATVAQHNTGAASRKTSLIHGALLAPGAGALGAFLVLAYLARGSGALPGDVGVERLVQSVPWGPLTFVQGWVTAFNGYTQFMAGFALLAFVILLNPRTVVFAVIMSMSGTLYTLSNNFVDRPRPPADLVRVTEHLGAHSFPSGHAVFAVTYISLLVLCVAGKYLRRRGLTITAVAGLSVILIISAARLVTGGHWPTDVYGGWLLAGGWALVLLSIRPIGRPVLAWLGDPDGAWAAHHPGLPNTFAGRRRLWARAVYTPLVQLFERLGFVVRGILWAVMGAALVASVFGLGQHVDLYGAVRLIVSTPYRAVIAVVVVIAIGGYAVWGYVRALLDPLRRGRTTAGLVARIGFLSSAISYTLVVAFTLAIGFTSSPGGGASPFDPLVAVGRLAQYGAVYVLGVIVVAIGVSQAIDGWREPFTHDVLIEDAPHGDLFHAWTWFGRVGLWARALLFGFLGVLIIFETAGGTSWSTSFAHAFERMRTLPGGPAIAVVLGLGLIALGLHSFGAARWMRLRPPVIEAHA